jgi:hypothetical protein
LSSFFSFAIMIQLPHNKEDYPEQSDINAWRSVLTKYYQSNAPAKVHMVNSKMMSQFEGKFDQLYEKLVAKYGPPGLPIIAPNSTSTKREPPKAATAGGPRHALGARIAGKHNSGRDIATHHDTFVQLVDQHQARNVPGIDSKDNLVHSTSRIDDKQLNSENGLETSTFTVCARMRPLLPHEVAAKGDCFTVVVPGRVSTKSGVEELCVL